LTADDCDDSDTSSPTTDEDPECDLFYLASNAITVLCPDATVGDTGYVDGVEYTKTDRASLDIADDSALSTSCTSGVTDMQDMFRHAYTFNEDIGSWDVSSVTNMYRMFIGAYAFNQDISAWDTSNVNTMLRTFYDARAFNQDIGGWDTSNVTDMNEMFSFAGSFNQDLSGWCVSNILSKPGGFDSGANAWTEPLPIWGTCP